MLDEWGRKIGEPVAVGKAADLVLPLINRDHRRLFERRMEFGLEIVDQQFDICKVGPAVCSSFVPCS